ncbi:hypothetical protein Salat_0917200 [Sesamum alatum]|uniref:Uncharacterized protein n=1 Tax=Sesamum alatum TaxID=300844 RepID=A0AAE1YKS6_9LAMI|nr:hypothetical protein Salat_0917200 [Sesamum alatum]
MASCGQINLSARELRAMHVRLGPTSVVPPLGVGGGHCQEKSFIRSLMGATGFLAMGVRILCDSRGRRVVVPLLLLLLLSGGRWGPLSGDPEIRNDEMLTRVLCLSVNRRKTSSHWMVTPCLLSLVHRDKHINF